MPYFGRRAVNGRFTRLSRHPIRSGRLPTPLGKRIQPVSWYGSLTVRDRAPRHRQKRGALFVADRQSTLWSSSSYRVSPFLKIPHANPIFRSTAFGTAHSAMRARPSWRRAHSEGPPLAAPSCLLRLVQLAVQEPQLHQWKLALQQEFASSVFCQFVGGAVQEGHVANGVIAIQEVATITGHGAPHLRSPGGGRSSPRGRDARPDWMPQMPLRRG